MAKLLPLRPERIAVSVVLLAWVVLALSAPWQAIAGDASRPVSWVLLNRITSNSFRDYFTFSLSSIFYFLWINFTLLTLYHF
jgi:hypothetical protein